MEVEGKLDEGVTDELDDWFDEDPEEVEEDQPVEEEVTTEEESSPLEDETEPAPGTEDRSDDASQDDDALEDGTSTDDAAQADNPYAWIDELDPDLRKEAEALVQRDRSQKGRVAALQRRLDAAQSQQDARERTEPTPAAPGAVADGKNVEDMTDEELEAFIKEFPSVAENVNKMVERRVSRVVEEMEGRIRPIQEQALAKELEANKTALRQEASRIFNSSETGIELDDVLESRAFHEWVGSQPTEYQQFARNAESVEAASKVLYDFAVFVDSQVGTPAPDEEPAASTTETTDTSVADLTAARRQQAKRGTAPKSRSAEVVKTGSKDDYEAYFDEFVSADENS